MIFGNENIIKRLNKAKGASFHILKGPKGVGKSLVGKALAKNYLCTTKGKNCGCVSCKSLKSGNHPDFFYISLKPGEKSIKVDDITPIVRESNFRPVMSEYKVILVDDADRMTGEAQDKLLKTLEEPPEYMKYIFVTHGNLKDTIESRGLVYNFRALMRSEMEKFLSTFSQEAVQVEDLIAVSDGCPGTAVKLSGNTVFFDYFTQTVESLLKGDVLEAMNVTGMLKEKDKCVIDELGENILPYLTGLQNLVMDMFSLKQGDLTNITFRSKMIRMLKESPFDMLKLAEMQKCIDGMIADFKNNNFSKEQLLVMFNIARKNKAC